MSGGTEQVEVMLWDTEALEISDFSFANSGGFGWNPPWLPKVKMCFFFQGAELLVIGSVQDVTSYKLTNGTMMPKWKVRIKPLNLAQWPRVQGRLSEVCYRSLATHSHI